MVLKVIEEASEAFGAEVGERAGKEGNCKAFGRAEADFTVYSFYATKHINTGEGAALLAADIGNLAAARRLRRFGIDPSTLRLSNGDLNPQVSIPAAGFNVQMNEIAAVIGLAALAEADQVSSPAIAPMAVTMNRRWQACRACSSCGGARRQCVLPPTGPSPCWPSDATI